MISDPGFFIDLAKTKTQGRNSKSTKVKDYVESGAKKEKMPFIDEKVVFGSKFHKIFGKFVKKLGKKNFKNKRKCSSKKSRFRQISLIYLAKIGRIKAL